MIEQLAVWFESLCTGHALYPVAADLRARIAASRTALTGYQNAVRDEKLAEADEEIAQANLRLQYEANYLEARRLLGRTAGERVFPRATNNADDTAEEPGSEPPQS